MSKELESLGLIKRTCELYKERTSYLIGSDIVGKQINEALDTIEQTLLKSQEQEKVLDIIKKKRVNVNQLLLCWKAEMYNSRCRKGYELSKEEFELLKEVLE